VAHVHVPEARKPVEVLAPLDVLNGDPTPADIDARLRVVDGMMQRMDQVLLVRLDEFRGGRRQALLPS